MKLLKMALDNIYDIDFNDYEKINFNEKCLIIANHVSLLDAPILFSYFPDNVYYVMDVKAAAKYEKFVKGKNIIKVNPMSPYSLKDMIRILEAGNPLVIFPEGRITVTGSFMKFYKGVSYLAQKSQCKVYPIIINGAEYTKLSYMNEINTTKYRNKVSLYVGDPFYVSSDITKEEATVEIENKLKNMRVISISEENKNMNIFDKVLETASRVGFDKEIMFDPTTKGTYKDLFLSSYVLGNKIHNMIPKEEKNIGLLLPTSMAGVIAIFSLFYVNRTPSMLNFSQTEVTVADACKVTDIKTIISSKTFIEKGNLNDMVTFLVNEGYKIIYMEDLKNNLTKSEKAKGFLNYTMKKKALEGNNEVILFTSGTESKPKGVLLGHENILANVEQVKTALSLNEKDRLMNVMPIFHSFGLTCGTICPLVLGFPVYLFPSPLQYKTIPELTYSFKATLMMGTSTFFAGYGRAANNYDFFNVRYAVSGAERLSDEVRNLWLEKFGIRILEGYGATEASPIISLNTPLNYQKGSVGKLLPGMEYKIEPVEGIENGGNLYIKGPNLFKGYYIVDKGFVPNNDWYATGDVVEVDKEGFITIKARLKRFAKIAGEMVSLNLVESVASKGYPDDLFASVSIEDKKKGEKIILFTTNSEYTIKEYRKNLTDLNLSKLITPTKIIHIPTIPILGTGKTNYVKLQELAVEEENEPKTFLQKLFKN